MLLMSRDYMGRTHADLIHLDVTVMTKDERCSTYLLQMIAATASLKIVQRAETFDSRLIDRVILTTTKQRLDHDLDIRHYWPCWMFGGKCALMRVGRPSDKAMTYAKPYLMNLYGFEVIQAVDYHVPLTQPI